MGDVVNLNPPRPTWVYRLLCDHGAVIYTGITSDLDARLTQHRRDKPWWPEVAAVEAHQFPSRAAARRAELDSITMDSPIYNIADVDDYARCRAMQWKRAHEVWTLPHRVMRLRPDADARVAD